MAIDIGVTQNFYRLRDSDKRIIIMEGSSRSGKTYSIIQFLIYKALSKKIFITVARQKLTWVRGSVLRDFLSVLENHFHIFEPDSFNKSECTYTFRNGSVVSFIGLDEAQKVHGRKQDISWLNEAIEIDYPSFNQIVIRTTQLILLDYNPSTEAHWIYDKVATRDDAVLFHSTYRDNPFLEDAIIREIEKLEPTPENIESGCADETLWKIYGLGLRTSPKGLIFPNATIVNTFPKTEDCKKIAYGLDFGYTNDPTALVKVGLAHGELFLEELIFERGLTNVINPAKPGQPSIEQRLRELNISNYENIFADSAEPKSIDEIKNAGFYNILPAKKGPDSILNGIDIIKRYKVNITESSVNLIREQRNYKWAVDVSGNATNKPIDAFCHCWDAVRYAVLSGISEPVFLWDGLADAMEAQAGMFNFYQMRGW